MKKNKKTFWVIIVLLITIQQLYGQSCVKDALAMMNTMRVPFIATKGITYDQWVGVCNPNGIIPDKLYNDIQGKDSWSASEDPELEATLFAKFVIPNTNFILAAVNFGGATDFQTNVLIVVDNNGNIKSALEAEFSWGWITPKQFRITNNYEIIISTLVPISSSSIPFKSFTQFEAKRVDETYTINSSGQFVKNSTKEFAPKIYTRKQLNTISFNTWS